MTKKNSPLVSVIIPVYNSEKYIEEAVNSISQQTYKNIEIIIINDASTDKTGSILKKLQEKDKRIVVFNNEKNLGIGANRKKGVTKANGPFVCWQDSDDISFPDRIESQLELMLTDESIGVVGGWLLFFDDKGHNSVRKYEPDDKEIRKTIFKYNPLAQPASMFRREVFDSVGSYNDKLKVSEDLEMFFRTGEKYKFANVQKPVIKYRQSEESLTASKLKQMEKETLKMRQHYRHSPAYEWTHLDSIYNFAQKVSMFMPPDIRMKLFSVIRGDKVE